MTGVPKRAIPSQLEDVRALAACSNLRSLANFPASPAMSTFVLILRVLTTIIAILVSLAPLPDFWRIHKNHTTNEVPILPVGMLFANCYMWALYAYLVNNIFPLFAVTLFGIATSIFFTSIYYRWTKDRLYVFKVCSIALALLAIGTLYYILATNGVTNQSDAAVEKTLGFIAIGFNLVLYASPLETMKKVVQTKNASSIPIAFSSIFLVNAVLWVIFAVAVSDMFVLVPNAIGTFLCTIQVVLYVIYRPGRAGASPQSDGVADAIKSDFPANSANGREICSNLHQIRPLQLPRACPTVEHFFAVARHRNGTLGCFATTRSKEHQCSHCQVHFATS